MIPARARGRVDLIINGSFWLGAVAGGLISLLLLKESLFALDLGWRLAFALGATLGLGILFLRRHLPESPRWLFIHGREDEAERLVDEIETEVREDTGQELEEPRRLDQGPPAPLDPFPRDRADRLCGLSEAGGPRVLAVHRPGVPLQRGHGHPRPYPDHVPGRRSEQGRALLRGVRRRELPRPAAPRPPVRHRRPAADDRRHVSGLGRDAGRRWRCSSTGTRSATGV